MFICNTLVLELRSVCARDLGVVASGALAVIAHHVLVPLLQVLSAVEVIRALYKRRDAALQPF